MKFNLNKINHVYVKAKQYINSDGQTMDGLAYTSEPDRVVRYGVSVGIQVPIDADGNPIHPESIKTEEDQKRVAGIKQISQPVFIDASSPDEAYGKIEKEVQHTVEEFFSKIAPSSPLLIARGNVPRNPNA